MLAPERGSNAAEKRVPERGGNALLATFLLNYIVLAVLVAFIVSDVCGLPAWYSTREHPPVTPEGRLQYVSEHIMRCKYSEHMFWRAVPWATLYCFTGMLMQVLHTWIVLHKIEALQVFSAARCALRAARCPLPAARAD